MQCRNEPGCFSDLVRLDGQMLCLQLQRRKNAKHLKYTEYRDFKKRCLLSAIDEINEQTDKIITFEEVKEGRKVVAIKFTIRSNDSVEALRIRNSINERLGYTRKQIDGQCSFFDDGQTATK